MAGFVFDVSTNANGDDLLRRMLLATQRLCRSRGLEWTFGRTDEGFRVTVDGPLPSMQALPVVLGPYLMAFADGAERPLRRTARRRVGVRLFVGYTDAVESMTDNVLDIAGALALTPSSYYFPAASEAHVDERLEKFGMAMSQYHSGALDDRMALEEMHTVAEWLLRRALRRGPSLSDGTFAQLIDAAVGAQLISGADGEALVALKDERRRLKHRGGTEVEAVASDLIVKAMPAMHRLATGLV